MELWDAKDSKLGGTNESKLQDAEESKVGGTICGDGTGGDRVLRPHEGEAPSYG